MVAGISPLPLLEPWPVSASLPKSAVPTDGVRLMGQAALAAAEADTDSTNDADTDADAGADADADLEDIFEKRSLLPRTFIHCSLSSLSRSLSRLMCYAAREGRLV